MLQSRESVLRRTTHGATSLRTSPHAPAPTHIFTCCMPTNPCSTMPHCRCLSPTAIQEQARHQLTGQLSSLASSVLTIEPGASPGPQADTHADHAGHHADRHAELSNGKHLPASHTGSGSFYSAAHNSKHSPGLKTPSLPVSHHAIDRSDFSDVPLHNTAQVDCHCPQAQHGVLADCTVPDLVMFCACDVTAHKQCCYDVMHSQPCVH